MDTNQQQIAGFWTIFKKSILDIKNNLWRVFKFYFVFLLLIYAYGFIQGFLSDIGEAGGRIVGESANNGFFVVGSLLFAIFWTIVMVVFGLFVGVFVNLFKTFGPDLLFDSINKNDSNYSVKETIKIIIGKFWPLFAVTLISSLLLGAFSLLFVVPGFIVMTLFIFVTYTAILEKRNILDSFVQSWSYSRGRKWSIFSRILLLGIILLFMMLVFLAFIFVILFAIQISTGLDFIEFLEVIKNNYVAVMVIGAVFSLFNIFIVVPIYAAFSYNLYSEYKKTATLFADDERLIYRKKVKRLLVISVVVVPLFILMIFFSIVFVSLNKAREKGIEATQKVTEQIEQTERESKRESSTVSENDIKVPSDYSRFAVNESGINFGINLPTSWEEDYRSIIDQLGYFVFLPKDETDKQTLSIMQVSEDVTLKSLANLGSEGALLKDFLYSDVERDFPDIAKFYTTIEVSEIDEVEGMPYAFKSGYVQITPDSFAEVDIYMIFINGREMYYTYLCANRICDFGFPLNVIKSTVAN